MSNVERDVILNQKLDQLKTKSKEAEYWSKIMKKNWVIRDHFTAEIVKISGELIELMTMINNKYEEFWGESNEAAGITIQLKNVPLDICRELTEDNHRSGNFLERIQETLNTLESSIQTLKDPNLTLEQIQAVIIPDFDWVKNNYDPSQFDPEIIKEKVDKVREEITKQKNAIEALELDDHEKVKEFFSKE